MRVEQSVAFHLLLPVCWVERPFAGVQPNISSCKYTAGFIDDTPRSPNKDVTVWHPTPPACFAVSTLTALRH